MSFNPFDDNKNDNEKVYNPFEPDDSNDNIFEAAGHGLLSGTGNVLQGIGHFLNYGGYNRSIYKSDDEYDKVATKDLPYQINKAIENYGQYLQDKHERAYKPFSANSISSGVAGTLPYMAELYLTGKAFAPTTGEEELAKAASNQVLGGAAAKLGANWGTRLLNVGEQLAPNLATGTKQAVPESLSEAEGARQGYIDDAMANGTYQPGITEQQAEEVGKKTLQANLGFIPGTDAIQDALMNYVNVKGVSGARKAFAALGIGGLVNAGQEMGQQIIPKAAAGQPWSLTDTDVLEAGLIGGLSGGAPAAISYGVQKGVDKINQHFNPFEGDTNDNTGNEYTPSTGDNGDNDTGNNGGSGEAYTGGAKTSDGEFESLYRAMTGQESGGDNNAVNGRTGAFGNLQIMPENWDSWSKEALGHVGDKNNQSDYDATARYKLRQLYDKYGAAGAAQAWYAGEGSFDYSQDALNRKQGNGDEPSINEYVQQVLGRMNKNGGSGRSLRKIPIANGIEDADLSHTNGELRNGIDELNTWVYDNFGKDLTVTGGWRNPEHNAEVNGATGSHHLDGAAVDIDASGLSPEQLQAVEEHARAMGFNSDGESMYHDKGTGYHLHLSLSSGSHLNTRGGYTSADAAYNALSKLSNTFDDPELNNKLNDIIDTGDKEQALLEANKLVKAGLIEAPGTNTQGQEENATQANQQARKQDDETANEQQAAQTPTVNAPKLQNISKFGSNLRMQLMQKPALIEAAKKAAEGDKQAASLINGLKPEVKQELQNITAEQQQPANASQPVVGNTVKVTTDSGKEFNAQYKIVDADSLVTSHSPENGFKPNPEYPAELQPRNRESAAMVQQIHQISNKLNPNLLGEAPNINNGAPLINKKGIVENGNGRSIAIIRSLKSNSDGGKAYRQYLMDNAQKFGLTPAQVASIKNPVLVRMRMDDNVDINDIISSTAGGANMSASEQAKTDAKALSTATLGRFRENETGDLLTGDNKDFLKSALEDITGNDASKLNGLVTADGKISQQGVSRVKNAIFAKAYNDDGLLALMSESTDDNIRNVTRALMNAAPVYARMRELIAGKKIHDIDIVSPLMEAVKTYEALKTNGMTIDQFVQQQETAMFKEETGTLSPEARDIITFMDYNKRSARKIGAYYEKMAQAVVATGNPGQGSMFGEAPVPSVSEIINGTAEAINGGTLDLFVDNTKGVGQNVVVQTPELQEESAESETDKNANAEPEQTKPAEPAKPEVSLGSGSAESKTGSNGEAEKRSSKQQVNNVEAKPKKERIFGDAKKAEDDFANALGLKPIDKKAEAKKDLTFNVIDQSDAALEDAFKDLDSELNHLSANPVFNPKLHKAAFKVGMIYFQRGANTFASWSKAMVEKAGERIKPWLGSVWRSVQAYPKNEKFDDNKMTMATQFAGTQYENGLHTSAEIYAYLESKYGAEQVKPYRGLIDSAVAGIQELYNPTLKYEETGNYEYDGFTFKDVGTDNDGQYGIIDRKVTVVNQNGKDYYKLEPSTGILYDVDTKNSQVEETLPKYLLEAKKNVEKYNDLADKEKNKNEEKAAERKEHDDIDGFGGLGKSVAKEHLIDTLNKTLDYGNEFGVMSRKDFVRSLVNDENSKIVAETYKHNGKDVTEYEAMSPKIAGGTKGAYIKVTKTEYDYYNYLKNLSKETNPYEKFINTLPIKSRESFKETMEKQVSYGSTTETRKKHIEQLVQNPVMRAIIATRNPGTKDIYGHPQTRFQLTLEPSSVNFPEVFEYITKAEYEYFKYLKDNGGAKDVSNNAGKLDKPDSARQSQNEMGRDNEIPESGDRGRQPGQEIESSGSKGSDGKDSLHGSGPAVSGKISDSAVQAKKSSSRESSTRSSQLSGSVTDSYEGVPVDTGAAEASITTAQNGQSDAAASTAANEITEKKKNVSYKAGNLDSIKNDLPYLLPGQQDNVKFAEDRLINNGKTGVMFTDGTGTGKTYTGLGIAKRAYDNGKKNILIVCPTSQVVNQWIESAKKDFGLEIKELENTMDNGGEGIVITTYANFGVNHELSKRKWDLVFADESHNLMNNEKGEPTGALDTLRAITYHPEGIVRQVQLRFETPEIAKLRKEFQKEAKKKKDSDTAILSELMKKIEAEIEKTSDERKKYKEELLAIKPEDKPKVVFLSATPFAYDKDIDYAEGYILHYGPENDYGGYNQGDARDQYMISNFGYRMRYNKLTRPEATVDNRIMEVQFHDKLEKDGAVAGRRLNIDVDYDRGFLVVDKGIGAKIDEGFEYLNNDENREKYKALNEYLSKRFTGWIRRYILESIKAKGAINLINQYLKTGKKVTVFHDTLKIQDAKHPFRLEKDELYDKASISEHGDTISDSIKAADYREIIKEYIQFAKERPDLINLDIKDIRPALEILSEAFPNNSVQFNGNVPKAIRAKNVKDFQNDTSGKDVIIVQSDAGNAGISLHDTTGVHQRVMINIGIPQRPIYAMQIEGRNYRTGSKTNCIIRYLTTGTNFEKQLFADTIAQRASTAENLAMGKEARNLRDAFVNAYTETFDDTWSRHLPGKEGEGTGGKEADQAVNTSLSDYDIAKTYYFANQKKSSNNKAAEGIDYFATPEPLGFKMVEWANMKDGERALEPSAGHGAISRWFSPNTLNTIVEPSGKLAPVAQMVTENAKLIKSNFEDLNIANKFDGIVMNPPYGTGGKTAMEHLAKAFKHLSDGGRVIAIIPNGPSMAKRLDQWNESDEAKHAVKVAEILLPSTTFKRAGTGVNTKIVIYDKINNKDLAGKQAAEFKEVDLRNADNIKDFFDSLENVTIPKRVDIPKVDSNQESRNTTTPANNQNIVASTFVHTKTKEEMPIAKLHARVNHQTYTIINGLAKKNNGYYSPFAKAFLFKNEDDRNAFINQVEARVFGKTETNENAEDNTQYSIRQTDNTDFVPDDNKSYRFYGKQDSPNSDWGSSMFADNPNSNSHYGQYAYSVNHSDLTNIEDLMPEIIEKLEDDYSNGRIYDYFDDADIKTLEEVGFNEFAKSYNPKDIVDSAEAYDSGNFINWLYDRIIEPQDIKGIKTNDGAFVFDNSIISRDENAENYYHPSLSNSLYQAAYHGSPHIFDEIPEIQRSYNEVKQELQNAFKGYKSVSEQGNSLIFTMPNGKTITANIKDQIIINGNEQAKARKAHGLNDTSKPIIVQGSWRTLDAEKLNGLLNLSRDSEKGTGYHEAFHAVWDMALNNNQKQVMLKKFNPIAKAKGVSVFEVMADDAAAWRDKRRQGKGSMFGKLYQRIMDMAHKLQAVFTGIDNYHNIMRQIETGEVWQQNKPAENSVLSVLDGLRNHNKLANTLYQIAYHATGGKYSQLDENFIGTGETGLGNSGYGWGFYTASDKEVAEGYRDVFRYRNAYEPVVSVNGKVIDVNPKTATPENLRLKNAIGISVREAYDNGENDLKRDDILKYALSELQDELKDEQDRKIANTTNINGIKSAIDAIQNKNVTYKLNDGMLLKLNIPESNKLLLWDGEFNEQSKEVQKVLNKIVADDLNGKVNINEATGGDIYNALAEKLGGEKEASKLLYKNGIQGTEYYDESRTKPDYVIFDKDAIEILDGIEKVKQNAPSTSNIQYSIRSATQSLADNLKELAGKKAHSKNITVMKEEPKVHEKFGLLDSIVRSPSYIAEQFPQFKGFHRLGDRAMQRQEQLRSEFNRVINRINSTLKNEDERKTWNELLLSGDAEGREFKADELRQLGYSENVITAYLRTRQANRKAYKLLNEARKQTQTHQENLIADAVEKDSSGKWHLKDNKFAEVLKVEPRGEDGVLVTYRSPRTWQRTETVTPEMYNELKSQPNTQILKAEKGIDGNYKVKYRQTIEDLHNLTGYIPHYFHNYFIQEETPLGNVTIGSGWTVKDAIQKADAYIAQHPEANVKIMPKHFEMPGDDEAMRAAVIGDSEYENVIRKIQNDLSMTPKEAREFAKGKVKTKSRNRFFGNFFERKGVQGYEQDMDWILRHYFNSVGRYVALEDFKPQAIGLFERYFGAFDKEYADNPLAHYAKQYIQDINGNPSVLETMLNNLLNRSDWYRKHIVSNFGDRAALQMANSITGKVSLLKLGFMNISSAMINLTQITNAAGLLNDPKQVLPAMKEALHPGMSAKKIFAQTGIANDIALDTTSGYGKFNPGNMIGKSMYFFKKMDMYSRRVAVLAGYHDAIKAGYSHEQAIQKAREVNRKANFDYSVADSPNVFRRGSIFSQVALQFKKYTIKEFELMHEIATKGNVKQNAAFWGTYFLLCGLFQIPALDWFDDIIQELFGKSPKEKMKKAIFEAAGNNPFGKQLAKVATYGLFAASPVNVDISSRAGVGDVTLSMKHGITGLVGGATYSTVVDFAKALAGKDTLAGLKALSPALANYYQAAAGQTENKRGRTMSKLDSIHDRLLKATGFRNVNESISSDVKTIATTEQSEFNKGRQAAVDNAVKKRMNGEKLTEDDIAKLKKYRVDGSMLKQELVKKVGTQDDRTIKGMSKRQRFENKDLINFGKQQ